MSTKQLDLLQQRKNVQSDIDIIKNTIIDKVGQKAYTQVEHLDALNYNLMLWKSTYKDNITDQSRDFLQKIMPELPGSDIIPHDRVLQYIDNCIDHNANISKTILGESLYDFHTTELVTLKAKDVSLKFQLNGLYGSTL